MNPQLKSFVTEHKYSDDVAIELLFLGVISLCMTLTNVLCVYFMGVVFLKVKEVMPAVSDDERQFWKHDIKIARDYNKTINAEEGRKVEVELNQQDSSAFKGVGAELLRQNYQHTITSTVRHLKDSHIMSIRELDAIYWSLADKTKKHHRHIPP